MKRKNRYNWLKVKKKKVKLSLKQEGKILLMMIIKMAVLMVKEK